MAFQGLSIRPALQPCVRFRWFISDTALERNLTGSITKKSHSTCAYVDRRTSLVYTRQYTCKTISRLCIYTIVSSLLLELYNSHYLQYNIIYIINLLIQHQIISRLYIPNNHKYVIKLEYQAQHHNYLTNNMKNISTLISTTFCPEL